MNSPIKTITVYDLKSVLETLSDKAIYNFKRNTARYTLKDTCKGFKVDEKELNKITNISLLDNPNLSSCNETEIIQFAYYNLEHYSYPLKDINYLEVTTSVNKSMLLPKITSDNVEDIRKWKPDVLTSITKYKVVGTSLKLLAVQEFEKKEVVNQ
jgi:hypothetical protein